MADELEAGWQFIVGDLVGDDVTVRAQLDDLLPLLRTLADRLDQFGDGVVLTVGSTYGLFTEERWSRACNRLRKGTSTFLGLERNTYEGDRFGSAMHRHGAGIVRCWLWLGDDVIGTELDFECYREIDESFSPQEVVDWMVRIAECSGMAQGRLRPGNFDPRAWELEWEPVPGASRAGVEYTPAAWRRFARDVAWGLWFTDEHVAALGGIDRIRAEAPVARVDARRGGVWLQLTESPEIELVAHLPALKDYLRPLFPTVEDLRTMGGEIDYGVPDPIDFTDADRYQEYVGGGLPVSGWDRVREEMEVTVVAQDDIDDVRRSAIERCVVAWVDSGTGGAFGEGSFHGWTSGWWDELGYHVPVDSGSQQVDWGLAIAELARRLGGCAAAWSTGTLSLRLGVEIDD